jgi:hypothetical protein
MTAGSGLRSISTTSAGSSGGDFMSDDAIPVLAGEYLLKHMRMDSLTPLQKLAFDLAFPGFRGTIEPTEKQRRDLVTGEASGIPRPGRVSQRAGTQGMTRCHAAGTSRSCALTTEMTETRWRWSCSPTTTQQSAAASW